jgi:HK97 family phage portal protein
MGFDGVRGYNVIQVGRNSMGSAIAGEKNLAAFWASGGRTPYHLEHPTRFRNDQDFAKFRKDWKETYADPHNAPILENGMLYKQDGVSMRDAQGIENRAFTVPEICRWFSVSPHLVADLSRATFSNIEHLALEFVKLTLSPWIARWEQEFKRCVLTAEERAQGYYLKYNVNALLRGDFQTRMSGYATELQNGIASIDEVRDLEDWNPLPDGAGAHHHIQLNMTTLPGAGDPPLNPDANTTTGPNLVRLN